MRVKQKMKITKLSFMTLIFLCCFISSATALDKATRQDCIDKCKQAAEMVKAEGIEKTLKAINDRKGPFVWKDSYVYCVNIVSQQVAAHPYKPELIGMQVENITDPVGKVFFAELIQAARQKVNTKGEGWLTYRWIRPGGTKPEPKLTFIYKVPEHQYLMAAGIFE